MAHRKVIATRTGRYGTRMLTAGEPMTVSGPAARAMIALGRAEAPTAKPRKPVAPKQDDDLPALRAEYLEKFERRPFMGWAADILRQKLAEA